MSTDASLVAPKSVPQGAYGSATEAINYILQLGHGIRYFPHVGTVGEEDLKSIYRHQSLYARISGSQVFWHPAIVLGDGIVLRQVRQRISAGRGSERHTDAWTALLARHVQRQVDALPSKQSLFKPPLWPVAGQAGIVKQLSIAPSKDVLAGTPAPERDVFWELACDMELKFWGALDWELVHQDHLATNPYIPLLELSMKGLYPLGVDGDAFVVFGRAPRVSNGPDICSRTSWR